MAVGCFNISCVLEAKLSGFWPRFGGHVGSKIAPCWVQEAKMADAKLLFGGSVVASISRSKLERKSDLPTTTGGSDFGPQGGIKGGINPSLRSEERGKKEVWNVGKGTERNL